MNAAVDVALAEGACVLTESVTEPQALAAESHRVAVFEGIGEVRVRIPGPSRERIGDREK